MPSSKENAGGKARFPPALKYMAAIAQSTRYFFLDLAFVLLEEIKTRRKLADAMRPLVELGGTAQLAHSLEVVVPAEKLIGIEVHLRADRLAAERNDRMHEQRADAQEIERVREHLPARVGITGKLSLPDAVSPIFFE